MENTLQRKQAKLLTVKDIMNLFSVGRDKAYAIIYSIPGFKIKGKLYVKPEELQNYLERNRLS